MSTGRGAKNERVPRKEDDEPDEHVDDLLEAPDEAVLLSALAVPEDNEDDEEEDDDEDVRFLSKVDFLFIEKRFTTLLLWTLNICRCCGVKVSWSKSSKSL